MALASQDRPIMLHIVILCLAGLIVAAGLGGFFMSFLRPPPNPDNSSRSSWTSTGGDVPPT